MCLALSDDVNEYFARRTGTLLECMIHEHINTRPTNTPTFSYIIFRIGMYFFTCHTNRDGIPTRFHKN